MLQERQQQKQQPRFPPITKPQRFKLLQDVTQQPYRVGMVHYYPNNTKTKFENDSGTDNDDTYDPGDEVVRRNRKEHAQRIADHTKDELDKVLKRVDNTINNYEYAVQSSLIQHGMRREDMNNVEHVEDIRELEYLLNDNLAKQRYKQRLMVFIVGQAEQAGEKAKLLQQLGQFFAEQKQNFSGTEFNDYDDTGETMDEIETTLKSFDVKDCYLHVKGLINRINELNEEIIQFLIQNTGTKQTKVMVERGKRKLAQVTKEAKEQLADLQSKLEMAHAELMTKDGKIQALEKDVDTVRNEVKASQESQKKLQDELKRREAEVKYFKRRTTELEEIFNRYKINLGDFSGSLSVTSQSETEDGDDASRMNLETIDETESKYEKESISSRTARDQLQSTLAPPTTSEPANNTARTAPAAPAAPPAKTSKKSKSREKSKRASYRSKKDTTNQKPEDDPSEMYRRSQQLLESLLADKSENAPDPNALFKPTRGVDLNNVTIDNLPTAFTNLRKFAIARVKELLKELETKETTNKETVQILKQEFVEHKTKYEKERLLYFLSLNPDENTLQEEQNALLEKADNAHKLQIKAQKTAEEALNHLELFMAEQEKLDQQDVVRQTELVHRHSVVVTNMTGANITPPAPTEEPTNDRLSPHPKGSSPSKTQWQKLSGVGTASPKNTPGDDSKSTIYETAQTLKRLSSSIHKTPPLSNPNQRRESVDQQQSPSTPLLRKTTQELLRKKSSLEQPQHDRSTSSSRRISMAINDDINPLLSKGGISQAYDRTPSMHSRPLTRSNSINPLNRDQDKSTSSGERSFHTSGAQSRRVSIGLNRSPVRAEELERVLTKLVNEEIEALEDYRRTSIKSRTSLREKYMSLLEEKKHQLDDLKQQADQTLSRPATSTKERRALDSLENSSGLLKKQSSFSPLDTSNSDELRNNKENRTTVIKHDQEQQTSIAGSRPVSAQKEKSTPPAPPPTQIIQNDQFKVPFFHLYETIYKFRHSIINLLEQNRFLSLADRLDMIKQISSSDTDLTNDFVENSERVLKDTVKVLQTCLATITTARIENDNKQKSLSNESQLTTTATLNNDNQLLQQKETVIEELNNKYKQMTQNVDETNKKYEETLTHNERLITEQQKLIQNLQRELMRLQKRLSKIETEGIVEPSIMFTRLDAERNEQTLKKAVEKGKVPPTMVTEINENMDDYNRLPGQQFSNIVKRYIQHRKATQLQDRIQSETFDNETKSVLERMGSFYERRSGQISERISSIRQHRTVLARTLTEKFDDLENESSIFLIRPIFSYQGRNIVKTYMDHEKRQKELLAKNEQKKKKHHHHRRPEPSAEQSTRHKTASSSASTSDDEEKLFQVDRSLNLARPTPASQQSSQHVELNAGNFNIEDSQKPTQLTDVSRLQEFDIQRTLMPVSHTNLPLSSTNTNDPSGPLNNLRSYVPISRPGVGTNTRNSKLNDAPNAVSRIELSVLSEASQGTNPRTPFNSTVGVSRRISPPLPPIKRSLTQSKTPPIDENRTDGFASVSTNDFPTTDHTTKDDDNEKTS